MNIRISDVAKKAGVSIATVSRIINNLEGYSEETRLKVQRTIKDLGFTPNAVARGLVNKKTHTIGVLLPVLSSRFSSQLLHGIESKAHSREHSVIICNTDRNGGRTMECLRILGEKRVDGIIFASEWLTDEYGAFLEDLNVPVALVSTYSDKWPFPYVRVDDRQAAIFAVTYLIRKGHRVIGHISGTEDDKIAGLPRKEGYRQALADAGIEFDEGLVSYGDFLFESGMTAMAELFRKQPELTAVFAASDEMAVGAMTWLHQQGVSVPEQVSVMGYDDTQDAVMSYPALTTLHQPIEEMGSRAVELILSKSKDESIILRHSITERDSVAPG